MSVLISQFIPPPYPVGVYTFSLYLCVSVSALQMYIWLACRVAWVPCGGEGLTPPSSPPFLQSPVPMAAAHGVILTFWTELWQFREETDLRDLS